jgi:LuxR family transcriptional regulator, maltose regulon positive regulatory protein
MAGHDARSLAEQGFKYCEQGGHIGLRGWSTLALARVLYSTGDWDELERVLIRFKNLTLSTQIPPWITSPIEALQGLLWLARGESERAAAWTENRALAVNDEAIHVRLFEYLVFAEYLRKTGQEKQAAPLLDRVIQAAQASGNLTIHIQALLVQSQLAGQMEDSETAIDTILQALKLAAPGGYLQTFIDAGEALQPWLQNEHVQKSFPEYTRRLLTAFDQAYPKTQQLIESLSAREIEVLQHIARGDRNSDIARELVISQNTVLFHIKNIFSKLNVNNRTQAIARARQLGLI